MTFNKDKFLDKVRKVLALTTSPNEHEAARAMERVQAMLAEHNLTMSDVATESEPEDEVIVDGLDDLYESVPWMKQLCSSVASLYFCRGFFSYVYKDRPNSKVTGRRKSGKPLAYRRMDKFSFVGAPHNAAVAKMMFAYLVETVRRLAREGAKTVPQNEKSKYQTSFKAACANRLAHRIWVRIQDTKAGKVKTEGGTNLPAVIYDDLERKVQAYMDKEFGNMRSHKVKVTASHYKGVMDGRDAGDRISLDGQVGRSKPAPALGPIVDGVVRHSREIDFTGDLFKRSHADNPGYYVYFGMWKGPFETEELAKSAYREWCFEARHG